MKTSIQYPGDVKTLVAPAGGVVADLPVLIGRIFAIPVTSVAATVSFEGYTKGIYEIAKASGVAMSQGDPAFWDDGNSVIDATGSGFREVGYVVADVLAGAAIVLVAIGEVTLPDVV